MRFWLARLFGTVANQMLMVALAWQMYDVTGSAWDLGLVGLFQFAPQLAMTLPAGHVVDRLHRGSIFAACMVAQSLAAMLLWFAISGQFATRELILGVSVIFGVARAFQLPAQQAITPLLVPQFLLVRAIALSTSSVQAAVICGPALGGVLYTFGPEVVYASGAVLLLLAFVLTLFVRYTHVPTHVANTLRSIFAGVSFVWAHKALLGAMSLDLFAVLLGGATALLPIYARDILQVGPVGLGLLRAAPAVGALLMSLALTRWPLQRKVGLRMLSCVAVFGVCMVVFGLSTNFVVSLAALAISGAADNVGVVIRLTLMQLETPDEMRGRVAAVNTIFIGASNQLGEFESGATAALFGPVGSVVLGGVGTLLVAVGWIWLFPALSKRDRMVRSS
ncbi:Transmembrane secretion effector [Propionivibrio dicarboxylicus]|uniref:Transmembrane secretion effector n=1 Tax=Propionivibrio dicarboxylicus TaxID=83767 RepID=A0A1G8FUZ1_9RHOO|nr:Transmembrane secretion effector [Propionivibrio dicarboxylicus]